MPWLSSWYPSFRWSEIELPASAGERKDHLQHVRFDRRHRAEQVPQCMHAAHGMHGLPEPRRWHIRTWPLSVPCTTLHPVAVVVADCFSSNGIHS